MTKRIILSGGSGFHMGDAFATITDRWLVEYVKAARWARQPKVLFINIAGGEKEWDANAFHGAFRALGCETDVLELICNKIDLGNSEEELFVMNDSDRRAFVRAKVREKVLSQDLIVVGGGNTDLLLYMLRRHEIDQMLKYAYDSGIVMFGLSAGGIYPTEGGTTDSIHETALQPLDNGLGWLPFLFSPHHQAGMRRKLLNRMMEGSALGCNVYKYTHAFAADDGVSLVFEDGRFVETVSDRPDAHGYEVRLEPGDTLAGARRAIETRLPTRLLT